ncbi:hypothetical protein DU478_06935 [Thalassococcus profundi]|jgi:hypothetical protein|uniref:Uncharacterized protein n=1 Tax=Thalassococcus profundi TaxID=2282382 RepID=A0A369TRU1_9RHOB|nr:hypothetical protein [Thalassococcus profundi]RDD67444.1 hypothetical protein DU478_06935 [Thalassococcus profundi]
MTFPKMILAAALALGTTTAPALAGDAKWKYSDGTELRIKCRNSGCTVQAKNPNGGKWVTVEKGPGGNANFKVLEAKYKKVKPSV